jgi:hypothetical protein
MTIAAARTRELDIGRICLRAYQLAGLVNESQSITADKGAFARDMLGNIIDEMQPHGLRARAVEFRDLTLVADDYTYTLDTDVLDVVGDAMFIDPDEADLTKASGEVPIVMIGRDEWQLLSDKSATGRPVMYYVHRTASPPEIRFWPIPDADHAGTVRFQIHRLAANSNDSSKTVDLERYFSQYLIWELCHHICLANSLHQQASYYGKMAMMKLELCKSFSAQRTPAQLVLRHRTGWHR